MHFATVAAAVLAVGAGGPACIVKEGPVGARGDAGPPGESPSPATVAEAIRTDPRFVGALIAALQTDAEYLAAARGPEGPAPDVTAVAQGLAGQVVGSPTFREEVIRLLKSDPEFIDLVQGEPGPQGERGERGPPGDQGAPGDQGPQGRDAVPVPRVVSLEDGRDLGLFMGGSLFDGFHDIARVQEDGATIVIPVNLHTGFVAGGVLYTENNCLGDPYVPIAGGYALGGAQNVYTASAAQPGQVPARADEVHVFSESNGVNDCQQIPDDFRDLYPASIVPVESYPLPAGRVEIR